MNRGQLVRQIRSRLNDASFLESDIITAIDSKILEIASDVRIVRLIEADSSIETAVEDTYVYLPEDFHHDLLKVYSETNDSVPTIRANKKSLYRGYTDGDTGTIQEVAQDGVYLHISPEASEAEVLRIDYYKKPDALAADTDEPDCIPSELRTKLIVHGVLIELLPDSDNDIAIIQSKLSVSVAQFNSGMQKLKLMNKNAPKETPVYRKSVTIY